MDCLHGPEDMYAEVFGDFFESVRPCPVSLAQHLVQTY